MTLISKTAACLTAMFLLAAGVTNSAGAEPAFDTNKCVPPLEGIRGDADNGQDLHLENCAECHGYDGKAEVIVMHMDEPPRDQTDAEYMQQLPDAFLFLAICNGGEGVGRSLVMPRWGDFFTNQEIYDLIAHIRSFSET